MNTDPRGANLITVSRMDTFQKCRYAHWLAYTLGIRRTPGQPMVVPPFFPVCLRRGQTKGA